MPVLRLRVIYASSDGSTPSKMSLFGSTTQLPFDRPQPSRQEGGFDEPRAGSQSAVKTKPPVSKKPALLQPPSGERETVKSSPPVVPARNPSTALSTTVARPKFSAISNTRVIGHKISVTLVKGRNCFKYMIVTVKI